MTSISDRSSTNLSCLIIGGGISGLITATLLQRRGLKAIVLDKGKGIGGRLATRRIEHESDTKGVFDYGAQYFSVADPQFQTWVDDWLAQGIVKKWCRGFDGKEGVSYCGVDGIRSIAKYLARDLEVHTQSKVVQIGYDKRWSIETEAEELYEADFLVMTPPVPQSLELLDASLIALPLDFRFSLENITYHRCITVLALLEKPSNIASPGGMALENESLAWLADNHQKGISPNGHAVTLHASHRFSEDFWDSDDAEIVYKLFTAAADYLDSAVVKYQVHRWRYSIPKTFYTQPCLALSELPLVMAGDGFVSPNIEGAALSGIAAGQLIAKRTTAG